MSIDKELSEKNFKKNLKNIFTDKAVIAYLLVIFSLIIGEVISKGFLSFSHVMSILQASFFLGLIGLCQTVVIMTGNEGIDLSVGPIFTMGVILSALFVNGEDKNIILALLIVLISGFMAGLVNGVGVAFLGIQPLIMTLSWGIALEGIEYMTTQGILIGKASPMLILIGGKSFEFTIAGSSIKIPWVIIIWILLTVIVILIFKKTSIGYVLYSIGTNDRAAKLLGIRTKIVRMLAYCFSGMFASLTGMFMLGYVRVPYLALGDKYMLPSIVAAIIGGVMLTGGYGSYLGTVAGAVFLTIMESILTTLGFEEYGKQLVIGLVLIILLSLYSKRSKTS